MRHGKEVLSDNTPLKFGKSNSEEGGIRVPMVVVGPGIPKASQFDGLVNQLDYFPTILNLTGSTIEPEAKKELSGLDITPVLLDGAKQIVDPKGTERKNLFWHFPHGQDSMKAALREGDFKLLKNYATRNHSLYRLYKNGQREDLEEMKDLATDPNTLRFSRTSQQSWIAISKRTKWRARISIRHTKAKQTPSAEIDRVTFEASDRTATATLNESSPAIAAAYVIYRDKPGVKKKKWNPKRGKKGMPDVRMGMKMPASISASGNSVGKTISAQIPKGIEAYCFLLIDENNYQTFSDIQLAE